MSSDSILRDSPDTKKFWTSIQTMQSEALQDIRPVRVSVVSEAAGEVTLIRDDDEEQEEEPNTHPRILGFRLDAGDAYALPLGNEQLLVLGNLDNGIRTIDLSGIPMHLDRDLEVHNNISADGNIIAGNTVVSAQSTVTTSFASFLQSIMSGNTYLKNADSPVFANNSNSDADITNNTSLSVLETAISVDITLGDGAFGDGTWDVYASGGVNLINSASATARVACVINNDVGDLMVTPTLSSSIYTYCVAAYTKLGVPGNQTITCKIQYRCGTASTTTADNPMITVMAKRVS